MYPCDKCTKNFLTAESLRSHAQRKHSAIEEKHESSDDNEKGNFNTDKTVIPVEENANQLISTVNSETSISKQDVSQSNNNNENEATTNCNACLQKTGINSSSVATQCDMAIIDLNEESTMQTKINDGKWRKFKYYVLFTASKANKIINTYKNYFKKFQKNNAHNILKMCRKKMKASRMA